jgi:hypothetical protein
MSWGAMNALDWLVERCSGVPILAAEANPFVIVHELRDTDGLLITHALLLV